MKQRSHQKEFLDRPDIPFADIRQNMHELDVINRWLGGHRISCSGLQAIINSKAAAAGDELLVWEIGCGGGDNLRALQQFATRKALSVRFTGIDINPHCIRFAEERPENAGFRFLTSDYAALHPDPPPDIVFASLFCHHFTDPQLLLVFQWMNRNSKLGFFVNDLHRHPLAFQAIRWLTRWFSKSYLVKNDAPLSVQRGFRRKELEQLLQQAGISQYRIRWKWAFRWLVLVNHVN